MLINSDMTKPIMTGIWGDFLQELVAVMSYIPEFESLFLDVKVCELWLRSLSQGKSRIRKQLDKLDNERRTKLEQYFLDFNFKSKYKYRKLPSIGVFLKMVQKAPSATEKAQQVEKFVMGIISNESLIMDIYGIARSLYYKSQLRVAYMGQNHVDRWVDVFRFLGADPIHGIKPKKEPGSPFSSKDLQLSDKMRELIKRFL